MAIIFVDVAGVAVFFLGTLILGIRIRRSPTADVAVNASRVGHALFHGCLGLPLAISLFYPRLTNFDALLGVPPLPARGVTLVVGVLLALPALWLVAASTRSLAKLASGAPAFVLTRTVVKDRLYERVRNPMSLGWYLFCVSLGLLGGSTSFTAGALCLVVPSHVFYLKFFEERELALRFGQPYEIYKRRVPFLIPRIAAGRPEGPALA